MQTKTINNRKTIKAWAFYDWANSVYNLVITTAIFPIFYGAVTSGNKGIVNGKEVDVVNFFGRQFVNTELYSYVFSFSFLTVVLMIPILSGIADYKGTKKKFMKFFCYIGAAGCVGLAFFDPNHIELSMLPLFIASIGFWGSLVFYNSFLPEIASKPLHDKISANGFSMGYVGSVLLLVAILIALEFGMPIKVSFLLVGLWWAGFAQYTYAHLPDNLSRERKSTKKNVITAGYQELVTVAKQLIKSTSIKLFLLAYFVYNMGVQTVMLLAVTFADKEINWPLVDGKKDSTGLIISILIIQLIAIIGAWGMAKLSKRFGNIKILMLAASIWVIVTVIAYFIHEPLEFYILAGIVGFVMGGIQSLSRSTYSKMIPKTNDNASYFSFYDVMEKVGLIFGPFFFGFIEGQTGDMRQSVLMLMSFFIVGFILLVFVQKAVIKEKKETLLA